MAGTVSLRYRGQMISFEKSLRYLAVRARAGMEAAMQADLAAISARWVKGRPSAGDFEIVDAGPSGGDLERDLDWLRARPAVAAASHVFQADGISALLVPNGNVHLIFDAKVAGHRHEATLTRYRLQAVEERGNGDYLVRITQGSTNPIATAAALQTEPEVVFAEPELFTVGR